MRIKISLIKKFIDFSIPITMYQLIWNIRKTTTIKSHVITTKTNLFTRNKTYHEYFYLSDYIKCF